MDQDSTAKGSDGDRRNWRKRLGINKDLPRLSEEFRSDQAPKRPEPRLNKAPDRQPPRPAGQHAQRLPQPAQAPAQRPAGQQAQRPPQPAQAPAQRPAGQQAQRPPQAAPAQRPGTPVARPAPMAPRPGAHKPVEPPPADARKAPGPPRPVPPPAAAARPLPQRPAAPTQPPGEPRPDRFAERLKAQREAAEQLARQRMQQARNQAVPPSQAAPAAPKVEGGPKFTFAQEEIAQAQRETKPQAPVQQPPPPGYSYQPPYQGTGSYQPPAQPYGRVPPPGYQGGAYQPRPYPQDYRPAAPGPYPGQRPPGRDWQDEAAAGQVRRAPVPDAEAEPDERGTLPPGRGLKPARGRDDEYAEDDLGDVFEDEEERPLRRGRGRGRGRARAEDYSAAYREYEDDYEQEEPRSRGGPLVLLLALMAVALIAGGLIYWYVSQKQQTADTSGNVPVITAPKEPVKTAPEPTSQQDEASQQVTLPQQPIGRKQIYDRILGDETLEPERIVPTEEQPQMPVPGQDTNSQFQGTGQQQGTEPLPLPLPLPPPPEATGQQGSLDVPQSIGKSDPDRVQGQEQVMVAEPASQNGSRSDLAIGKSDAHAQTGSLNLPVPEMPSQEMMQQQSQEAVQAKDQQTQDQQTQDQQTQQSSEQQQLQQIIETDQTPEPAPRPQKPKLVEKPQQVIEQQQVVVAPPPPQQQASVQQPFNQGTGQGPGPISLSPLSPQANPFDQPVQQPQQFQAPQQTETSTRTTTRLVGRDDDPLEGQRVPFSSPSTQSPRNSQQPSDLGIFNQQPAILPQPVIQPQQQVASVQPPQPQPQVATGYVAQLAAFRSEGEAQSEYQRLAQRHAGLLGGLAPQIQRADLGASGSFYRLSVGTLASEAAARKLCNALISAGERDCLVRRQ
jgi:hypothetical protein